MVHHTRPGGRSPAATRFCPILVTVIDDAAVATVPLYGREFEIGALESRLDAVGSGGGAVVVRGEAGDREVGASGGSGGEFGRPRHGGAEHDGHAAGGAPCLRGSAPAS